MNKQKTYTVSEKQLLMQKYKTARGSLLLILGLTLLNIVLIMIGVDVSFLFSASIPYYMVLYGVILCGKAPIEWYGTNPFGYQFLDEWVYFALLAGAVVILAIYALCYFLSKKSSSWIITALVFFAIDTVALIVYHIIYFDTFVMSEIINYAIHGLVIYEFVVGIISYKKAMLLPDEQPVILENIESVENKPDDTFDFGNFDAK